MKSGQALVWLLLAWAGPAAADTYRVDQPQRLSAWLEQRPPLAFALGLVWTTPQALAEQRMALAQLQAALEAQQRLGVLPAETAEALRTWLQAMPPTGRVRLPAVDISYLQAKPQRDPMLAPGDGLRALPVPEQVRVLTDDPQACVLDHRPGLRAVDYVRACVDASEPWAWLVQPDGRLQRVGLDAWNQALQDEPAAGAWIWAPRRPGLPEAFHRQWAQWLAWQGPANAVPLESLAPHSQRTAPPVVWPGLLDLGGLSLTPEPSSSDWGNAGLLQTPTARMRPEGSFALHMHRAWPYRQVGVMLQPLPWLETGFRYVSIENRRYGPAAYSGDQDYKDKSIDLKLRLLEEGRHLPQLALGWRDMGGTGLFSSEYLVASKRWGRIDASLGLGWGYLGNRAMFKNPLTALGGERMNTRTVDVGQGGTFATGSWFHGPSSLFGGLQYQSPWNLDFKLEFDPGNYQREPLDNRLPVRSPLNWGMVYKPARGVELSLGLRRGNQLAFGWTLHTDLAGAHMPKVSDPPLPPPRADREQVAPRWQELARELERHTQWQVEQVIASDDSVTVQASQSMSPAPQERLDKAVAVLDAHLPQRYRHLSVEHQVAGQTLATETVERDTWLKLKTQPPRSGQAEPAHRLIYDARAAEGDPQLPTPGLKASLDPGLDFFHTLGGPDGFLLYQFSLALRGSLRWSDGTEIKSTLRQRLLNNYDKFRDSGSSDLPRVRTHLREYFVSASTTLSDLSLSRSTRLDRDWTLAVYGGLFEEMFGGVGSELLYRQPGSRWALGLDLNRVRQRDFRQDLRFRDYQVNTGHLTAYWNTPWQDIEASLAAGRYLAGDRGVTLTLAKTFANGARMGAFATKTNVPAAIFGEGSFDKGIFWSIPLDAILTRSSRHIGHFAWKPLTRDGGAKVIRPVNLYQDTQWLSPEAYRYRSAPPPNDRVEDFERTR